MVADCLQRWWGRWQAVKRCEPCSGFPPLWCVVITMLPSFIVILVIEFVLVMVVPVFWYRLALVPVFPGAAVMGDAVNKRVKAGRLGDCGLVGR